MPNKLILSSFTFSVEFSQVSAFESCLKEECIPFLKSNPEIAQIKLFKLLTDVGNGAQNISLQIYFEDMEKHLAFEAIAKDKMLQLIESKFAGKYVFFPSLLEEYGL